MDFSDDGNELIDELGDDSPGRVDADGAGPLSEPLLEAD